MSRHLVVKLLSSYIDQEVTPAQLRLVEGHLGGCAECRRTLAGLQAVSAGVRRLEAVAPPPALSAAVERRVRMASLEEPKRFRLEDGLGRWAGQPVLAPVFAIILALGAMVYLFAFGVSKSGRHTTRLVVAAAPDRGDSSAGSRQERRSGVESPLAMTETDSVGNRVEIQETEELKTKRVEAEQSKASGSKSRPARGAPEDARPSGAGTVGTAGTIATDATIAAATEKSSPAGENPTARRERMASKREVIPSALEKVAPASPLSAGGVSASSTPLEEGTKVAEQESTTVGTSSANDTAVPLAGFEDAPVVVEGDAPTVRELGGRRFVKRGDLWIEAGLGVEAASEVLDLRGDRDLARLDEAISVFRDLERVRLRIGDRVVEVIFPEPSPRDK